MEIARIKKKNSLHTFIGQYQILQMYKGGMNSFNDLVLSNGSNFYPQENDKLDVLKRSLYNKAISLAV